MDLFATVIQKKGRNRMRDIEINPQTVFYDTKSA